MFPFRLLRGHRLFLMMLCTMLCVAAPQALSATGNVRTLSGPDVSAAMLAPNGQRVVYLANGELYSIAPKGGTATKLNGPLAAGTTISTYDFVVSPDSTRVVYAARHADDQGRHLYSVPITGGARARLTAGTTAATVLGPHQISPDSRYVVFTPYISGDPQGPDHIYSVPIDGSAPALQLTPPLKDNQDLYIPRISPGSTHVVYQVNENLTADTQVSLYSVPITGGSTALLSGPAPLIMSPVQYVFTPDNSRIVHLTTRQPGELAALYSVALTGGANTKISAPAGVEVSPYFQISPDSSTVVFLTETEHYEEMPDLYRTPANGGGTATKVNQGGVVGHEGAAFSISADSRYIVYHDFNNGDGGVYSAPLAGGSPRRLSSPHDAPGEAEYGVIHISPDSSRVVYFGRAGATSTESRQLYSVPITGSQPPARISSPVLPYGTIAEWEIRFTPNSKYILYRAEGTRLGYFDLFIAPADGHRRAHKLNGAVPITAGAPYNFQDFQFNYAVGPDSTYVVFRGADTPDGPRSLYVTDIIDFRFDIYLPLIGTAAR